MAGKKGRSGPPNNTNASRNGAGLLWRRGRRGVLRAQDVWVRKPMQDLVRAFMGDLPDLSTREREVIETVVTAKGCELLIGQALSQCGLAQVVDGHVHVAKASEDLAKFMKLKLDALRLLPAGRRAKTVASLTDYLNGAGRPEEPVVEEEPPDESA